ncbi:hypothetical protein CHLRE_02g118350v5 [Chlamydomonas reinhardtii]|uniref:Major facilitator superfamily associated domain-containing protein n=1 Tax=Chlamydomonas reinhardtii TaxID=3055 RepID=A0A2K3E3J3_CHLRE|nr:uncharacterized protein CHLRE_02g118350v5 [Chlamydomonas reinhardtii]PNW87333.1 hypothetical protein CHLRE_02g118350v5 [Chlamydomonas reinhardtii]
MARQLNEMLLAKGWYLFSAGGAVFLLPYLYPFISSKGVSDPQIGLLAAVRPWLAAVAAMTGPALADKFKCHRSMMVGTFAASILLRASIYYAAEARYLLLFTVVIVSEYVAAPPGVLADAAVVALCSRQQGAASYGRQRLWGSIGWGGLSFAAGVLLDSFGYGAGFLVYLVLSAPCIYILARFSCGGGSSSSGGKGRGGSSNGRQGRKVASCMHGGGAGEGSAGLDARGEECLHTEEALLPHAHEPFPFIRALVRTISGVPPTPSPPGPLPHRRRPPTPRLQGASRNQGDGDGSHASRHYYQQPVGLTSAPPPPPPALPPPVLMHLSTPFGYEEAQHPHGVSAAISIAAVEAATTIPAASDGSCQAGSQQRYSIMKLSSSVEAWIQRSEIWIRQREREREAAAAAPTTTTVAAAAVAEGVSSSAAAATMAVRAGAFLGSPGVSRHSAAAAAHGATAAALTAASDEEEQAGLLGPSSTVVPAAASTQTAATPPAVHVVANIFGPACVGRSAAAGADGHASISPAASYHVHAVSSSASAAAIPPLSSTQVENSDCGVLLAGKLQPQQLAPSDTLESIPLGSPATATGNPDTAGGCSSKQPQCGMDKCPPSGGSGGGADGGGGFLQRAGRLLSDGAVWLFLAKVFLLGFGTGTIGTWLFIYVSSLGASHALQGLMLTMNCVAEVPVFYFQEAVTRRFPAGAILHVATGSLVLRLAAYAALPALPSPWFVLPVELMQGLTFALSWGTCCVHCKRIAPESLQATMQGLWQAVFNGLASGAGGLAGAVLHDRLGGRSMFATTAGLIFGGWLLLAAAEGLAALVAARRRRRAGSNPSDECVHLMNEEESGSSGRGGSGGFGGHAGEGAQQQCLQVVVAAPAAVVVDNEKRALLAGGGEDPSVAHPPSSAAPTPSGARRGHGLLAARSLMGKAAFAGVSHVLRLALAGAWRHGFHTASAAAASAAAAAVSGAAPGSKPSPQGATSCGNTTRSSNPGPPSYDDVAADMTRGGMLYSLFVRRRTASIGGGNPGISGGGAGSGVSSPKQSLLSQRRGGRGEHSNGGGSGGGDGSRRGMHSRGGSAVALASEALLATSDGVLITGLESASSDVAFDGGRDQGRPELMGAAACNEAAAPAMGASTSGASGSSGGSSDSGSSGSGSGMLDALGQAAAAASPPVLPASLATAWL